MDVITINNIIITTIDITITRPRKKKSDKEGCKGEVRVVGGTAPRHYHHQRTRPADDHHHGGIGGVCDDERGIGVKGEIKEVGPFKSGFQSVAIVIIIVDHDGDCHDH